MKETTNGNTIMYTVGSLFSGCGGTALGFERAGFKHKWFVENNKYAAATLSKNFPGATVYGDIKTIDFSTVPDIDVLEGGFPCQDISNAGKRAGITGDRSSLWKHFARAISVLRPKYVSIENVSALTRRGLDVVLCDLATLGYDAEWHCISASAVGAPHRRDRIFIICYPNNNGQPTSEECASTTTRSNSHTSRAHETGESQGSSDEYAELADTESTGLEVCDGQREPAVARSQYSSKANGIGHWSVEPNVGRVAHGVSNRVDRIKCLGNAVVPQNAEVIAKAIMEKLHAENN